MRCENDSWQPSGSCVSAGLRSPRRIAPRTDRAWLAENEVNVGYSILPEHRGNSYGSRALGLVRNHLGGLVPAVEATLLIDPANGASLALASRAGFQEVARIDDVILMKPIPNFHA